MKIIDKKSSKFSDKLRFVGAVLCRWNEKSEGGLAFGVLGIIVLLLAIYFPMDLNFKNDVPYLIMLMGQTLIWALVFFVVVLIIGAVVWVFDTLTTSFKEALNDVKSGRTSYKGSDRW